MTTHILGPIDVTALKAMEREEQLRAQLDFAHEKNAALLAKLDEARANAAKWERRYDRLAEEYGELSMLAHDVSRAASREAMQMGAQALVTRLVRPFERCEECSKAVGDCDTWCRTGSERRAERAES